MKHTLTLQKCTASTLSCALALSWLTVQAAAPLQSSAGALTAAAADEAETLPARYDAREETPEILTTVRNQNRPICWAYAAMSCIESNLIKQGYADNTLNLSAAHLIWFTFGQDSPTDPADTRYGGGQNCGKDAYSHGGYTITTVTSLASWQGVVPSNDALPLTNLPLMSESERYRSSAHLQNANFFKPYEQDEIKQSILKNGALVFDYFQSEGYILSAKAGYYNADITMDDALYKRKGGDWHAVTVIGWDDNYSKDNFNQPAPGDGAWIAKNSYGNYKNSENGYFYMSYYEPTLYEFASYEMEPVNNYGSVHSYNCSDISESIFSQKNSGLIIANVFEAKEAETVAAVGFYTSQPKEDCEISVYALEPDAVNPEDGTLAVRTSETIERKGFHTVKLPETFRAEAGQKYAVTVKYPISSYQYNYFDSFCYQPGVSYYTFYTADQQNTWKDCYSARQGDNCIHVYTAYEGEEKDTFIRNHEGTLIDAYPEALDRESLHQYDTDNDGYVTTAEYTASASNMFDINRDGLADARDLTLLKRASLGLQKTGTGTNYDWHIADLNIDGHLDAADVDILFHYVTTRPVNAT